MLWAKDAPSENLIVRGARVLDPAGKVDGVLGSIRTRIASSTARG